MINDFDGNGIEVKRGGVRFPGDPPTGEGDAELFVKDTIIRNCDQNAVLLSGDEDDSVRSVIEHCRIENNLDGINAIDNSKVTARDSVLAGSRGRGVTASGVTSQTEINLENCLIANGQTGVESNSGGRTVSVLIRISHSTITNNVVGISATLGAVLSRGNNTIEGNSTDVAGSLGTYSAR